MGTLSISSRRSLPQMLLEFVILSWTANNYVPELNVAGMPPAGMECVLAMEDTVQVRMNQAIVSLQLQAMVVYAVRLGQSLVSCPHTMVPVIRQCGVVAEWISLIPHITHAAALCPTQTLDLSAGSPVGLATLRMIAFLVHIVHAFRHC